MTGDSAALQNNPLLVQEGLPPFDRIQPTHVVEAVRHVLAEAEQKITGIENNIKPTWSSLVEPLEELDRPFEYAWGPVNHFMGVKNSDELRKAHKTVLNDVVAFSLRVSQSKPIYKALKELREGPEWEKLSEAQKRVVELKLRDTELAGVGLEGEKRERFNNIAQELSQFGTDFGNHVLDATKAFSITLTDAADVEDMPPSLLQLAAQSYNQAKAEGDPEATPENGPWRFTLDYPSYVPFMEHCKKRDEREKMYRAFNSRASSGDLDNSGIIPEILKLRREMAGLLGFGTYAELSLAKKMAPNVAAVQKMFDELRAASWEHAVKDLDDIQSLAAESGESQPIEQWDVGFWSERLREKRFDFTDEQLRPYFQLPRVLEGLFGLAERLFGIRIKPADGEAAVWHKDVRFFKVFDETDGQIAAFYLDPYSRPEDKRGGAWMDDCLARRRTDGQLQIPVAHLVCNSTPPVGDRPSLMTFREVETLFHEFGHGLQHMLTTVDYADVAGISGVEWDAVELPSQFMENWCYHKPTLIGMTAHVDTGQPLPDDLFEKICKARTYRAGSMMLRQLLFGMVDMELHDSYDPDGQESVFDVHRRIAKITSVLPPIPNDRFLCAFQHIFGGGYSAGYYSYKWAEVLSADAFGAFEDAGLDDENAVAETGRRFRDTVLALGGSRHPMDIFKDFRGREHPNRTMDCSQSPDILILIHTNTEAALHRKRVFVILLSPLSFRLSTFSFLAANGGEGGPDNSLVWVR